MSLWVISGVFFILFLISVMILLIICRIIKQENELVILAEAQAQNLDNILTIHDFLDEHLSVIDAMRKKVERIESEKNVYRKR